MDKCPQCYLDYTDLNHVEGGLDCLRRQLAAANERAGRLEAEREELTIAFHALEPAAHDGRLIALYGLPSHESYKTFARILGGA